MVSMLGTWTASSCNRRGGASREQVQDPAQGKLASYLIRVVYPLGHTLGGLPAYYETSGFPILRVLVTYLLIA